MRLHSTSGVSGVVPKFLDSDAAKTKIGGHKKVTVHTHRHIIKGSSRLLPCVSLNEHLCMQVTRRLMPAAVTEVSRDGQALVVHRFDVDENGRRRWGMEDFCALLGLRPAAKYETTWEHIAKAVRDHVPMAEHPGFTEIGKRMLLAWQAGIEGLRDKRIYAMGVAELGDAFSTFSDPQPVRETRHVVGRSELVGRKR